MKEREKRMGLSWVCCLWREEKKEREREKRMGKIRRGEKKEETKNTKNKILLLSFFGWFGKIFLLKMFSKIQPNTFPSQFSIFSENENKKQPNQTPAKDPKQ